MIGKIVSDRYKILRYLGGGMSSVYLADDIILDRKVVVKMIKVDQHNIEKSKLRFQREVQSTIQLSHPNIVSVLDVDETHEYHLLVTEVVDGPTLKEYIEKNHPISFDEITRLALQILNGIKHAHNRGIIHRDIKPQNILLDENNQVKITDFGIAKALSETRMTETNQVMGSVQYISPEQAKGQSTDERTDIYSFGILLFELLTGTLPYAGETPVSVALKHISETLPDINDYREVPQGLKNIVLRCTEKNPLDRFRHVDDVIQAMNQYKENSAPYVSNHERSNESDTVVTPLPKSNENVHQQPSPENTVSATTEEDAPKKKKRRLLWLIPLLLIIAAAGIIIYLLYFTEEEVTTVSLPDMQDMTLEEAEAELNDNQLVLGEVTEEYNETFDEGQIINTTPRSGADVDVNSSVDVLVSQGKEPHEMEDYTGETYEDIQESLNNLGFNAINVEEIYDDSEPGTIISQSIDPGEAIHPEDENLTLEVSQGVEPIEITNYTGEDINRATSELEAQGFNVSVIQEVYHDSVEEGNIISQDPSYGDFLPGSNINMVVSLGEEPARDMQYVQSVELPYPEEKSDDSNDSSSDSNDSSDDSGDTDNSDSDSEDEPEPAQVEIYLGDRDNDIKDVFDTVEITEDDTYTIRLVIEEDSEAEFKIDIDGETYMEETVPYGEE